jgi:hypothetical protein
MLTAFRPLLANVNWAVADAELTDALRVSGTLKSTNSESAETIRSTLEALFVMLANVLNGSDAAAPAAPDGEVARQVETKRLLASELATMARTAKVSLSDDRVRFEMQGSWAEHVEVISKKLVPAIDDARLAAQRDRSMYNLKNLQLAMLLYHDQHGGLPVAAGHEYRVNGKVRRSEHPHSWRIDVLPLLDQQKLYEQYRFDEPWDSEANLKVLKQMPDVFRSPFDESDSTNTSYFVLTGPQTVFSKDKSVTYKDIIDGTSHTISIVESKRPMPWTKPEDIEYAADKPVPQLGGWETGRFLAAFMDGHIESLPADMNEKTLREFIAKDDRTPTPAE